MSMLELYVKLWTFLLTHLLLVEMANSIKTKSEDVTVGCEGIPGRHQRTNHIGREPAEHEVVLQRKHYSRIILFETLVIGTKTICLYPDSKTWWTTYR